MVLWWLGTAAAKQWSKLGSHIKQLDLTRQLSQRDQKWSRFFLSEVDGVRRSPDICQSGSDLGRWSGEPGVAGAPPSIMTRLEELEFLPTRVEVRDFVSRRFQLSLQLENLRARFRIKIWRGKRGLQIRNFLFHPCRSACR
jgi:hypothetical protein